MRFDETRVLANARAADTDDLLDRVTAYRGGLEPEAVELLEMELRRRGVTAEQIAARGRHYDHCLRDDAGVALMCSRCRKPARTSMWTWHWVWGWVPLFPKKSRLCEQHQPQVQRA